MDSQQFKAAATSAIDETVEPGYLKKILPDGPPQEGEGWADIQKDIEAKDHAWLDTLVYPLTPNLNIRAYIIRQSPNFMAFFPASSTFPGMLGDLYSAAFTAPAFNWICSPAATELETIVMDWLAKLLNLPECYLSSTYGGGVIQGSASEAIVTVMVAARDKYLRETTAGLSGIELEDAIAYKRSKLVALGSEMAHSSTQKGAQILGVRFRTVPVLASNDFAMTGEDLEKVLQECKAQGLEPFYLTTTMGTTATCAVDDFASIAAVLSKHTPAGAPGEVWVHVDAAYAGAALVCPEFQYLTSPLQHFHSFDMNMHKWLLTNFDCSCLYVKKKRKDLIDALSITPSYLRNEFSDRGLVTDYRDWQIPLGRRFRSLKVWFVLRTYGVQGLRAHIRDTLTRGDVFADLVKSRKDLFRIITGPNFALTVMAVVPKVAGLEAQNQITAEVYELVNKRGEIYITSSVVKGTYAIRVILVETTEEVRDGKVREERINGVGKIEKAEAALKDGIINGNGLAN
ncbi:hypothetical protein EYC84_002304 [Monilinia fructicola]|uniref:Aromatic-L-amino-acid decarboxylase n=1 Tax=Monilinia fructicola TaxID=38448 RepID=A0A5M9JQ85_MONFR|nr:hypothetical protein EYC84_002304 [Monilinia fructicola]